MIGDNGETQVKIGDFGLSRIAVTDDPLTPCPGHKGTAHMETEILFSNVIIKYAAETMTKM